MGAEDEERGLELADTMAGDLAYAATLDGPVGASRGAPPAVELTKEHPNRYELGDEIGRGGMGRVILAKDRHLGREVAVKELLVQSAGSKSPGLSIGIVQRFLREARVTGQLEHPGIVPVHELGQRADGSLYYTMKRIRGRSLKEALDEASTLDMRLKLITPFRHVCETVAYAHSRGVVHRDLKPDNVMVGAFGETLLVDWGLAKAKGEEEPGEIEQQADLLRKDAVNTLEGHAIGTPAYMSPEQARGELESIDERSDVWSLGAMLFEILTGRPPHQGDRAIEVLRKVLEERPPKVREVAPDAPPELAAVADRALLRDRTSRYPGAAEVAREIAAFQDGRQVHAYDYSSFEMLKRFVARHRAASIAAVVVVAAGVLAAVSMGESYRGELEAREIAEHRRDLAVRERSRAEAREEESKISLTRALIERAERALDRGDPAGAAILAAAAMQRDPHYAEVVQHEEGVDLETRERVVRALSAYLDAEETRRMEFVRDIEGASELGMVTPNGQSLVYPLEGTLQSVALAGGAPRSVGIAATRVVGFLGDEVVMIDGDAPGAYRLRDGALQHALPSGVRIAVTSATKIAMITVDSEVVILDRADFSEDARWIDPDGGRVFAAWNPRGELLTISANATSATLRAPPHYESPIQVPLSSMTYALALSPSGRTAAVGFADPRIGLLDLSDGLSAQGGFDVEGWVTGVDFFGESVLAVAEGGSRVVLYDVASRRPIDTMRTTLTWGHGVTARSSSGYVVTLPTAAEQPSARVFRWASERVRPLRDLGESVRAVAVDVRQGRLLVATFTQLISLPMVRNGFGEATAIAPWPPGVGIPMTMTVAPDGAIAVATSSASVLYFAPGSREARVVFQGHAREPCLFGIAFRPQSDVLFFGDETGAVHRWSRTRGEPLPTLEGHRAAVCGLSFSPDGSALATGSLDGSVRLWDPVRGVATRTIDHTEAITDVAFSPDGTQLAVTDRDGQLLLLRYRDALVEYRAALHRDWINRVAWSPDGTRVITVSDDRTLRIHRVEGALLERIVRTGGLGVSLALSPTGAAVIYVEVSSVTQVPLVTAIDLTRPDELLRAAETRAGVSLDTLEAPRVAH